MMRSVGTILLLVSLSAVASADPYLGLAAYGRAEFGVSVNGTYDSVSDGGTEEKNGDTSFYAGVGNFVSMSDTWDYEFQVYVGDDENGNPIYETQVEPQYESGSAEAYAYSRFDRGGNAITAEVYAYATSQANYSGSVAFASASAGSSSTIDITFSLANWTNVTLFTSTLYDTANVTLLYNGTYLIDATNLYGLGAVATSLAPGDYQLVGDAYYGGADLTIQAVPEPASMAALGVGLLALRRRRSAP